MVLPVVGVVDIGGEVLGISRPRNGTGCADRGTLACVLVGGGAAADLEAQELLLALVEFVVAYAVDLEAEAICDLDGGLVVEEGREQRACAGEVAGGDDDVGWVLALEPRDVAGQVVRRRRRARLGIGRWPRTCLATRDFRGGH
jgi:hypothetical protein